MFFLTPSHVKHGRQFVKDARKLVAYKRDLVSEEIIEGVNREITHLEHAVSARDQQEIEAQMQRLDQACGKLTQPQPDAGWRENVEVFLVAIVIALAVRTYFLQPFTIPTGSMQPTLNGIIGTPITAPLPNAISQAIQKVLFFRTYIDVVAQADESIVSAEAVKRFGVMEYTELVSSAGNRYLVHASRDILAKRAWHPDANKSFDLSLDRKYKQGEVILRGYVDTGDHVFVDKFSYHFLRPKRDQVFVFSTRDIQKLNVPGTPSQFYIKRLAGVPNDELRIDPPRLYSNGDLAPNPGFQRVMAAQNGYRGYSHGADGAPPMGLLSTPEDPFTVPPHNYFALGDNSFNSYDSRGWGPVPEKNITGRALFVYYPFASHFGWIW